MNVRITCEDCDWVHEVDSVTDIPPVCPHCQGEVSRFSDAENPEDVKSDNPDKAKRDARYGEENTGE